jgi:two-component system, OmpR family, sensor kinase
MSSPGAAPARRGNAPRPPSVPLGPGSVRRWMAGRTLRGRLIAGLLALLALACAAVGLVTYLVLSHTLINQLDLQLHAAGGAYPACMERQADERQEHQPPTPDCNKTPGLSAGTFGARVKDGMVTNQGIINGSSHLSAPDQAKLVNLPPDGEYYSLELPSIGGDYRLTAVPGRDHDVLITGLPLSDVEATLQRVEIAEISAFSAALVLTGLLGTGFVRLSLVPLRRVAATATRVTQLPLASGQVTLPDRVPDANPRTEVGQVGAAFNRMLGHVEAALARRAASEARLRRFAADASHELRTPLAAIRGYAELALRHPGPVPADIEHALHRVEAESSRMSVLVDELLLLAQLDAGRPLAQEPVDVTRLAIDATSDARAAAPTHRWLLELPDEPVHVRGDEHRLHQVLANLMSNAAKHTPPGTTVTVTLTTSPPGEPGEPGGPGGPGTPGGPGSVAVSVTDDGPGIPPGLQPTLFERFVRGDTARTRQAGQPASTGLGLAIVDAVTTAHGGTVHLDSKPGTTRFTITLPRLSPRELAAHPRS